MIIKVESKNVHKPYFLKMQDSFAIIFPVLAINTGVITLIQLLKKGTDNNKRFGNVKATGRILN
jgi:hypothetical protein